MDSRTTTLAGDKEVGRTAVPSSRSSFEKEEKTDLEDSPTDNEDGSIRNANSPEEEVEGQYPEGLRLAFIVIALLLSIFLVSFPMHVSLYGVNKVNAGVTRYDHCRYSHTQNHRPVPRSGSRGLVWISILLDCWRLPINLGKGLQVLLSQDHVLDLDFHL